MIIPSRYDDINSSILVLGAHAIKFLKPNNLNVDELYQKLNKKLRNRLSPDLYFDVLTFLWVTGCIELNYFTIELLNKPTLKNITFSGITGVEMSGERV